MNYYALCQSYHSYTEAVFWATTKGRLFGPKMKNGIKAEWVRQFLLQKDTLRSTKILVVSAFSNLPWFRDI